MQADDGGTTAAAARAGPQEAPENNTGRLKIMTGREDWNRIAGWIRTFFVLGWILIAVGTLAQASAISTLWAGGVTSGGGAYPVLTSAAAAAGIAGICALLVCTFATMRWPSGPAVTFRERWGRRSVTLKVISIAAGLLAAGVIVLGVLAVFAAGSGQSRLTTSLGILLLFPMAATSNTVIVLERALALRPSGGQP